MSANTRVADYAIHPQFTDRWSPRAFTGEAIPKETLLSFFEARAGRLRLTTRSRGAFFMRAATRRTGNVIWAC
ncbi:hypothetical protein PS718_02435 [Pseudomonas fluorescens]|uniref:Uncharacterized protein n=1 Tax=Pseudomonas fluorescens TaxID=294 RepID=A0A5E7CRS6_PSEFL|nr:hypothetical protein PS718_02435 [Pseudomonas fluorescens]